MGRIRVCCVICHHETTTNNINKHYDKCIINKHKVIDDNTQCPHCNKIYKSKRALKSHEKYCHNNKDRVKKRGCNQYIKAKELGLPPPTISEDTRKKISENSKISNANRWTPEERKKQSQIMKKTVQKYPESYSKNNVSGRVKMYEYNNTKLKGKWELDVAIWLDFNNIKWTNDVTPKQYYWNNDYHLYFVDFYIPDYDISIEVKGYKTERDEMKWKYFKDPLVIIDKNIYKNIKTYTFEQVCSIGIYKENEELK